MMGTLGRVLVTGGGRGIGREISLELGRRGWKTAIHYGSDLASAEQTQKDLGEAASGVYQCDLTHPSRVKDLFQAVELAGPLTALVNNAGIYMPLSFLESSDEDFEQNWSRTMAVNFESPLLLSRLAAKSYSARGGGKILNVSSRVGFRGEAGAALYSASKAALINLTRAMAVELAPNNIQTFAIAPGWVDTSMARDGMQERLETILEGIPLGRMATPADCANAAAFLLDPKSEYLSGIVIDINGASYLH